MNLKNKIILTDVDGVLLNWHYAFEIYMETQGYRTINEDYKLTYSMVNQFEITEDAVMQFVKTFNESAAIGFLPPLRDAIYYVKMLHEQHGYQFHAITSMGTNRYAMELRKKNLQKLFGGTVFDRFVFLDTCAPKGEILDEYKDTGCMWIEDNEQNARDGHERGLNAVLMEHGYNMNCTDIPLAKNWKEIYENLTKS